MDDSNRQFISSNPESTTSAAGISNQETIDSLKPTIEKSMKNSSWQALAGKFNLGLSLLEKNDPQPSRVEAEELIEKVSQAVESGQAIEDKFEKRHETKDAPTQTATNLAQAVSIGSLLKPVETAKQAQRSLFSSVSRPENRQQTPKYQMPTLQSDPLINDGLYRRAILGGLIMALVIFVTLLAKGIIKL